MGCKKIATATTVLFLICFLSSNCIGQGESVEQKNDLIRRQLEQKITLEFEDSSIIEVIKELEKENDFKIVMRDTVADFGLDVDSFVTVDYENITIKSALKLLLDEFCCTYVVKDEVVYIILIDEADLFLVTKTYDCNDLIENLKPVESQVLYYKGEDVKNVRRFGGGGLSGSHGGPGGVFSITPGESKIIPPAYNSQQNPSDQGDKVDLKVNEDSLVENNTSYFHLKKNKSPAEQVEDLVCGTVDPESWKLKGGKATVRALNGVLFINQTEQNHSKIEALLKQARSAILKK